MSMLNKQLLQTLGIHLSDEDYALLSEHFESTLHERVINEVVLELSPEQAEQLASMQNSGDEEVASWLQTNVPNLGEIVSDEVDILLGELAEDSQSISG